MHQVRIHGRGGQGVVTAAELIAIAAFADGWEAQAFPFFGVERTGAPIEAYARFDKEMIKTREQVYAPDVVIIQDPTLIGTVDVLKGAKPGTHVIVNTSQDKADLDLKIEARYLHTVDATKIALDTFGQNIVNTVILGAFARATKLITLEGLKKAVEEKFADKGKELIAKNIKAVTTAYKEER